MVPGVVPLAAVQLQVEYHVRDDIGPSTTTGTGGRSCLHSPSVRRSRCGRRRRVPRPATACDRPRAKLMTTPDRLACRPMQPLRRAREFPDPQTRRVTAARDADACDRCLDHRCVRRRRSVQWRHAVWAAAAKARLPLVDVTAGRWTSALCRRYNATWQLNSVKIIANKYQRTERPQPHVE